MKKIFIIFILTLCLLLVGCEKNYDTTSFLRKIEQESNIFESHLAIIIKSNNGNSSVYSNISSGIVVKRENSKYFAITSCAELSNLDQGDQIFVLLNNEELWDPSSSQILLDFYKREAKIEAIDDKNNLAMISFQCEKDISIVKISQKPLKRGTKVASISNSADKYHNFVSFGIIESKQTFAFEAENGKIYDSIKHSCYIYKGTSGSLLINEDLELVGMNIGYTKDLFGKIDYGIAIYCDKINQFLY